MSKKKDPNRPLEFKGEILDNVHGFISYTEAEEAIMETPLFKRLQSLKQLSVINWVFPGSEHTRYTHSLGVMYIADKMAISMGLSNKERRILRMAGLLHDIGHYPLSHVGESPYSVKFKRSTMTLTSPEKFCDAINTAVYKKIEGDQIARKTKLMRASDEHHHEAVGALIVQRNKEIRKIIEGELGVGAAEVIADIITGNVDRKATLGMMETDPLWVQMMHSELDADGIDYIMRDSLLAGTGFGSGEIAQLIRCMRAVEHKETGVRILCVETKGVPAADQYLINKFFHYSQVVFNKHIIISEWMAQIVVAWMRDNNGIFAEKWMFPNKTKLDKWLANGGSDDYLKFTDHQFWTAVEEMRRSRRAPDHIKRFCEYLIDHEEPNMARREEIRIVSRNDLVIKDRLRRSETYEKKGILGPWITVLETRTMTKQMPEKDFEDYLKIYRKGKEEDMKKMTDMAERAKVEAEAEDFVAKSRIKRLMDCICVADVDGNITVLCDHERSLMQDMYNETVAILRSYEMDFK